jgi:hypothetical protein
VLSLFNVSDSDISSLIRNIINTSTTVLIIHILYQGIAL